MVKVKKYTRYCKEKRNVEAWISLSPDEFTVSS